MALDQADPANGIVMAEAVTLWQEITGVDPEAGSLTLGEIDVRQSFEELRDALLADETELTAQLMLGHFLQEWVRSRQASYARLLDDPVPIERALAKCRRLRALQNNPLLLEARDRFTKALERALEQYGAVGRADVRELLADTERIAFLRRDAQRSISRLRVHQFLRGSPEAPDIPPVYVKDVLQWFNINSLLSMSTSMPSGVSMNLIRHPSDYESYFAFAIRNGGNLFVLTDTPEHSHPLQAGMRRRPDRHLEQRMNQNWFPYDLLGVEYNEDMGRMYFRQGDSTALVPVQAELYPLKAINQLSADQLVWTAMMFDLIVERFWRQGWAAPELSYTGAMVVESMALAGAASSAKLPVAVYEPPGFQPLRLADVTAGGKADGALGHPVANRHRWMEERYGPQVSEASLEQVSRPDILVAIDDRTGERAEFDRKSVEAAPSWKNSLSGLREVKSLEATAFGTRAQLEADRLFLARHNLATAVDRMAREEFEQRRDAVQKWYLARCAENAPRLLKWAGYPKLLVEADAAEASANFGGHFLSRAGSCYDLGYRASGPQAERRMAHAFVERFGINENTHGALVGSHNLGTWMQAGRYRPVCFVTGQRPTWRVVFSPASSAELALLAGCEIEELPDVLQQWSLYEPYSGNNILDRIDPMVWAAQNPWLKLDFRLNLALSKRGLARLEKNREYPPLARVHLPSAE